MLEMQEIQTRPAILQTANRLNLWLSVSIKATPILPMISNVFMPLSQRTVGKTSKFGFRKRKSKSESISALPTSTHWFECRQKLENVKTLNRLVNEYADLFVCSTKRKIFVFLMIFHSNYKWMEERRKMRKFDTKPCFWGILFYSIRSEKILNWLLFSLEHLSLYYAKGIIPQTIFGRLLL